MTPGARHGYGHENDDGIADTPDTRSLHGHSSFMRSSVGIRDSTDASGMAQMDGSFVDDRASGSRGHDNGLGTLRENTAANRPDGNGSHRGGQHTLSPRARNTGMRIHGCMGA